MTTGHSGRLVVSERNIAMGALGHVSARAAHDESRIASAVEQQDCLLLPAQPLFYRCMKRTAEHRAVAVPQLFPHVDDPDGGQRPLMDACLHAEQPVRLLPFFPFLHRFRQVNRFQGRSGGTEHDSRMVLLRPLYRDIPGMVLRAFILLIRSFVLFIDNDKSKLRKRGKKLPNALLSRP